MNPYSGGTPQKRPDPRDEWPEMAECQPGAAMVVANRDIWDRETDERHAS